MQVQATNEQVGGGCSVVLPSTRKEVFAHRVRHQLVPTVSIDAVSNFEYILGIHLHGIRKR